MSRDIKFSPAEIAKIIQSGRYFGWRISSRFGSTFSRFNGAFLRNKISSIKDEVYINRKKMSVLQSFGRNFDQKFICQNFACDRNFITPKIY